MLTKFVITSQSLNAGPLHFFGMHAVRAAARKARCRAACLQRFANVQGGSNGGLVEDSGIAYVLP